MKRVAIYHNNTDRSDFALSQPETDAEKVVLRLREAGAAVIGVHVQGGGRPPSVLRSARDDLDRWRAHLEGEGIAIEADFNWPNGARSIYIRDPAGNSVEFAEPALWAAA